MSKSGEGWGGYTSFGPLHYFGGGTQDVYKISAQTSGDGVCAIGIDPTLSDFRPYQIRASVTHIRSRIPDESDPNGYSTLWCEGVDVDKDGITTHVRLKPIAPISFENDSYILTHSLHGLRVNNAADTDNLFTIEDDGRVRIFGMAGSGKRAAYFDSSGYLCI